MGDQPNKPRTKVVVRRLPPALSEEHFWEAAFAHVPPERVGWRCYVQGKASAKAVTLSRAYLSFKREQDVFPFQAALDGHVFVSDRGNQYRAAVEYAPSQKVPGRERQDKRDGTLHKDQDFKAFCKQLEVGRRR